MWQQVHQKQPGALAILGVAVDAQGPDRPRHYVEKAGVTFPVVVDQENVLAKLFNYKVVPNGVFVDENGVIRYVKIGGFEVRKPEYAQAVEAWAKGAPLAAGEAPKGMEHPEALRFYDEGLALLRKGDREGAVRLWRKVVETEPDNFVVRKQIWAVEHPEKFYDGAIDSAWQKEQLSKGT